MEFVDTHCHPQFDDFLPDNEAVVDRARKAGVNRMISVGVSLEDSQKAIAFAAGNDGVWATAGAHPHDGKEFLNDKAAARKLQELLKQPKVVAVGEIGLDYYHEHTPKDDQAKILAMQIEAGLKSGLPFVFHVRDAWGDFWTVFDKYPGLKGVIHSFTGGPKQLDEALGRGLYIALNGIVTFTRDQALLAAAKKLPLEKLLLETDAPFLTPAAAKGQVCEPKHVRLTAEFLAGLRGEELEQLAAATTANAIGLFNLR